MNLSLAKFRVPAWECNVCREVYLTEGEAVECCEKTSEGEVYCCRCGEIYYLGAEEAFVLHLAECSGVKS